MCQVCAENGIQQEATNWCQGCALSSDISFFCPGCDASEHQTRTTKSHARLPVENMTSSLAFSLCLNHSLPQELVCLDENVLICKKCREEDHKSHKTKSACDYEDEIRAQLTSSVGILKDPDLYPL